MKTILSVLLLAAGATIMMGCKEKRPQWIVSVTTDAPVPQLGDHLLLEVIGSDAGCSGCLRVIGVNGPESLPVSFGVVPQTEPDTVRVRARLYRAELAGANGLPDSPALIDAVGQLPPLEGVTHVAFNLSMDCFGVPSLIAEGETCDPTTGKLGPEPELPLLLDAQPQPIAGSWPNARLERCEGTVPEGMVCVPGGVFLLGTPRPEFVTNTDQQTQPEHLVQLDPFAMDIDEVTVGTVRELLVNGTIKTIPVPKDENAPESPEGACTFLDVSDSSNDALPLNCISHEPAQEVCVALGKRLPTEAEWEYAAGNITAETAYPWGSGGDPCQMAVIGVGRNLDEAGSNVLENYGCRPTNMPSAWGPVAGGHPKDVTFLGIRNLAGSLREWVVDVSAPYTAPCWQQGETPLVNPVCTASPGSQAVLSRRGGYWAGFKVEAKATRRVESVDAAAKANPYTGLRCVLSM